MSMCVQFGFGAWRRTAVERFLYRVSFSGLMTATLLREVALGEFGDELLLRVSHIGGSCFADDF
jgi:hypothetical protein